MDGDEENTGENTEEKKEENQEGVQKEPTMVEESNEPKVLPGNFEWNIIRFFCNINNLFKL